MELETEFLSSTDEDKLISKQRTKHVLKEVYTKLIDFYNCDFYDDPILTFAIGIDDMNCINFQFDTRPYHIKKEEPKC